MRIITGHTGENHIEAGDVQALIRGLTGPEQYRVLSTGMELEAELVDANTIRVNSGDIIFQGIHCRIPYGESDTITIANGSPDYDRRDVIALHYEKDATTGVEDVSWVYYQGPSTGKTPTVISGNIEEGALVAEVIIFTIVFKKMAIERINAPSVALNLSSVSAAALSAETNVQTKAEANDVFYKAGDTATLYYEPVCGEIYSNKKTLRFFVPISRPLKGVTKVSITAGTYQVKANNTVIVSESSLTSASKTVTLRPNGITVSITKSSGFSGSANAVCAVSGSMTVKFSA
jgi:hypothetical protein